MSAQPRPSAATAHVQYVLYVLYVLTGHVDPVLRCYPFSFSLKVLIYSFVWLFRSARNIPFLLLISSN